MAKRRKKSKNARRIVAVLSDLHCGHRLGLLNPETVVWDEDAEGNPVPWSPRLTATEQYLWTLYESHLTSVRDLADGAPVILLANGDLTQGVKYPASCWSDRLADHIEAAAWCLYPWIETLNVTAVRIIQGTASHTDESSTERLVGRILAERYKRLDVAVLHHELLRVGGVLFDVAHHGPGGGIRQWTDGNVARYYLKSLMLQEIVDGREPPRFVFRAHVHRWIEERVKIRGLARSFTGDLVVTPGYSGINGHGRQVTRSVSFQTHGMAAVEVDGDWAELHQLTQRLDLRTEETL